MDIDEVVKKAEEFGYKTPAPCEFDGIKFYHKAETFMDPAFWQALGKAFNWNGLVTYKGEHTYPSGVFGTHKYEIPYWQYKWYRFIQYLANGGSPQDYFKYM